MRGELIRLRSSDCEVELWNDPDHTPGSADNLHNYPMVYSAGRQLNSSQHGVRTRTPDGTQRQTLLIAGGGHTGVHEGSALILDSSLFVCCGDQVFQLLLPNLDLVWSKQCDDATCFSLFRLEEDLLVHGELDISRIDKRGNVKWQRGGRDIFVNMSGGPGVVIAEGVIRALDFQGNAYCWTFDGVAI
jgi:hypothetical protein